jgi:hypothetical protein
MHASTIVGNGETGIRPFYRAGEELFSSSRRNFGDFGRSSRDDGLQVEHVAVFARVACDTAKWLPCHINVFVHALRQLYGSVRDQNLILHESGILPG